MHGWKFIISESCLDSVFNTMHNSKVNWEVVWNMNNCRFNLCIKFYIRVGLTVASLLDPNSLVAGTERHQYANLSCSQRIERFSLIDKRRVLKREAY